MTGRLAQDDRCAVCGRPLGLTADPDVRDEGLDVSLRSEGLLPICPDCQDELYYGDDGE